MNDFKWLKEALDKLENKVDKLDQRLDGITMKQVEHTDSLKEHMLRTELAEENISILREEFKPVQTHVTMLNGVLKAIGIVSLILGLGSEIIKILDFFKP